MPPPTALDTMPRTFDGSPVTSPAYGQTLLGWIDARFLCGRRARIGLAVLLAAALIVPSVQFVIEIQETKTSPYREGETRQATALGRWLPTAELIRQDPPAENPYGYGHWFPTPTFNLVCLAPLTYLGYGGAAVVWAALKVGGLVLAIGYLLRSLHRDGHAVPVGVLVMAAAFGIRPVISDIQHGNLNLFVVIYIALAWGLYLRGRHVAAGVVVALAIVAKITPALLLVYFLYKRAWWVCIGAGAGLILFVVVIPGAYLGFGQNIALLRDWFEMLVAPFVFEGYGSLNIDNQALFGVLMRLVRNVGLIELEAMPGEEALFAGMDDMFRPVGAVARLLRPAISVGMVGVLAWLTRPRHMTRGDIRQTLELGLILLAMLLLSERTWKHHATTLPLVYIGVWYVLTCVAWSAGFRAVCVGALAAQFGLLVCTSEGLIGDRQANMALDGGLFGWGLLLAFVQIAVMLRRLDRRAGPAPVQADSG